MALPYYKLKNLKYLYTLVFLLIILFSCEEDPDIINPEEVNTWKYYNTSNGLTDNMIYSIKQDKSGNIWVGTDRGGINMFDGSKWINYTVYDGLLSNRVYAIDQDADGTMWFGTSAGINLLIDQEMYYIDKIGDLPIVPISLFNDSKKRMWIGTEGQGIFMYDENGFNYALLDKTEYWYINYITEDLKNNVWFATFGGALYFDGIAFSVFDETHGLNHNYVTYILEDSWGDIWFSSFEAEYLTRYNGTDVELISLFNGKPISGVSSMVQDLNRNIWFTTGGAGIVKYNGAEMLTIKIHDGLKDNWVLCSTLDKDGNLWFGTLEGGINVYITK